jgi:hypothetical protein
MVFVVDPWHRLLYLPMFPYLRSVKLQTVVESLSFTLLRLSSTVSVHLVDSSRDISRIVVCENHSALRRLASIPRQIVQGIFASFVGCSGVTGRHAH